MLFFLSMLARDRPLRPPHARQAGLHRLTGTLFPVAGVAASCTRMPCRSVDGGPGHSWSFALFVGMNLANSANPVLARILLDLRGSIGRSPPCDDRDHRRRFRQLDALRHHSAPSPRRASGPEEPGVHRAVVPLLFVVVLGVGRWLGPPALVGAAASRLADGYIAVTVLFFLRATSAALGSHRCAGLPRRLPRRCRSSAAWLGTGAGQPAQKAIYLLVAIAFFAPLFFVSMALRYGLLHRELLGGVLVLLVLGVALD